MAKRFLFLAILLLFASCILQAQSEEVSSDVQVKVVRVVVNQTYEKADKVSLSFYDYTKKILEYAGFSVVDENAKYYDATLYIDVKGIPGGAYYSKWGCNWNWEYRWTEATLKGTLSFSINGGKTYCWNFSYTEGPYSAISGGYFTPNDAPFRIAFDEGFLPFLFKSISELKGISPLISALKDEDWRIRWGAAYALGEIKDPRAVEPLIQALKDEDSGVRCAAANALVRIGEPAVEPLIQALKDDDSNVREKAAWALGWIGDKRAVEPLIQALKDEDSNVRQGAAYALGEITGKDFGTDYNKWNEWWQKNK
ncbi:MAG: HEAT repeat domain-containing protein [Archaeoglobaceae archaeon]|nr:HEAT repeat domain-containing protein [Archaeoglobaceae archaeon]